MRTTGSRMLFATRPMAVRVTLCAIVAPGWFGLLAIFRSGAEAGPACAGNRSRPGWAVYCWTGLGGHATVLSMPCCRGVCASYR